MRIPARRPAALRPKAIAPLPPLETLRATLGIMTAAARIAPELPALQTLRQAVEGALEGKQDAVELALVALLARGHLLIEDVPGVGKTTLARAVAKAVGGELRRVQFTSDLLPSDVLGVSVYDQRRGEFVLRQGPIFANILLADEINRASPRTQSALLEAMNEGQVSLDGQTIPLPDPFFVIATQNPQDFAGTFPLPESQLDRFLLRVRIGYPPPQVEMRLVLDGHTDTARDVPCVLDPGRLVALQREVERVTHRQLARQLPARAHPRDAHVAAALARRVDPRGHGARTRGARARAASRPSLLHRRRHPRPRAARALAPRPARHAGRRLRPHARRGRGGAPGGRRAHPRSALTRRPPCRALRPPPAPSRAGSPRWRRRLRPPRRLKFTREGKFFVGITLGVGFAAINTANNLLYLLLGMLLALIVVSGIMSELSLRDLTVVRRLPLRAQVGPRAPRRDRGLSTTRPTSPRMPSRSRTCAPGSPRTSAASF